MKQLLFADDTALVADSQERLRKLVEEFPRMCERRKVKGNDSKSKVIECTRMGEDEAMDITLL